MAKKMPELDLADEEKVWQTKRVQKKIQSLYKKVAKEMEEEAAKIPDSASVKNKMRKNYLNQYVASLEKKIDELEVEIYNEVTTSMNRTAKSVVDANIKWAGRLGLNLKGAFDRVPEEVVRQLITGRVYKNDFNFSKSLWRAGEKTKDDLHRIIAEGVARQKPTYDIAKDLETYVNPTKKKPWDWGKVYPGTTKKVDYNAQRLARTLIQHAYQQSYQMTIRDNPFVEGVIWRSVFAIGRTCLICMDRDGQKFPKGQVPLDHPMGLCYLEPDIPKSMDEIAGDLASWAHGAKNTGIDKYVRSLYNGDTKQYSRVKSEARTAKAKPYKGRTKNPAKNIVPKE